MGVYHWDLERTTHWHQFQVVVCAERDLSSGLGFRGWDRWLNQC